MSTWASLDHIRARLTYGEITASSSPDQGEVQEWLDQAEAETRGVLRTIGAPTSYSSGSDGERILRKHVVGFAEGSVRAAWASANGDGDNVDGASLIQAYQDRLLDMQARPSVWAAMLDTGGESPAAARRMRSHTRTGGEESTPVYEIGCLDKAI